MEQPASPKWEFVKHSSAQIGRAGRSIRKFATRESDAVSPENNNEVIAIIDNWRVSHAYPLHVIYLNLKRSMRDQPNYIVAERLKRIDSIIAKLIREPNMSLFKMQDIAGCRLVVSDVEQVYKSAENFKNSGIHHKFIKEYDYILSPKKSGYRSLHHVYEFRGTAQNGAFNKNMLVEIQFRTKLQHLWATAVETMGIWESTALKAGVGRSDIKRFFLLTSNLIAIKEKSPLVEGVPPDLYKIINEIKSIDEKQHCLDVLNAMRVASYSGEQRYNKKNGYYLLVLDFEKRMIRITHFNTSDIEKANQEYNLIESKNKENNKVNIVLVSVASFEMLKQAYPNYFLDIKEFVLMVKKYIS